MYSDSRILETGTTEQIVSGGTLEIVKPLNERINEETEEIGQVDFMKKIGKNEYDLLELLSVAPSGSDEVKTELSGWDRVLQFKAQGVKGCYLRLLEEKQVHM